MSTPTSTGQASTLAAQPGGLAAVVDQIKKLHDFQLVSIDRAAEGSAIIGVLPDGKKLVDLKPYLDTYLDRPERRRGTAKITDAVSFIGHINRFAGDASAVFVNPDRSQPTFTAVYDYHPSGATGAADWLQHRAVYAPALSDQWRAWLGHNGKLMPQAEFAQFIEDRITDVIVPNFDDPDLKTFASLVGGRFAEPSDLVHLSRGLQINIDTVVKNAVTLGTGEIAIRYEEVHRDGEGQPIQIANLFQITIPVFYAGTLYRLAARLRYRNLGGKLQWSYLLVRPELAFDDAIAGVKAQIHDETHADVFLGSPEA